jgi:hypothetical protein
VFHSGVRTYRPGFKAWVAETANHPLALPHRIAAWNSEEPKFFENWIIDQALSSSVRNAHRDDRLPSFTEVRQHAAELERAALRTIGGNESSLLALFEDENDKLRNEIKEQKEIFEGLLSASDKEREVAEEALVTAKAQALERAHRIRVLQQKPAQSAVATPDADAPNSLDDFEDWCKANLSGSVELVNRAYQGVRKSNFEETKLIYQALSLLRDFYVPMRIEGTPERRDAYQGELKKLGLEDSLTGNGTRFDEDGNSVQYAGRKRALDRHLKSGSSRDPRFCFRLYFFWDEDEQVVVVGWLPSHLDSRST